MSLKKTTPTAKKQVMPNGDVIIHDEFSAPVKKQSNKKEAAKTASPSQNTNEVKIGNVTLKKNQSNKDFIPQKTQIVAANQELETIALAIENDLPVLLIGDTGTGKTSFIRYLAHETNNAFRRLNLNGSTTTDELIGHYVVDDKKAGMRWIDGVLTEAMKAGHWLLLDELNAGLPEVLFALQSVLDDDKFLVIAEHEGEIVRPHPNFRVFATMNPSMDYAGTRDLNKALLSRFPIVIQCVYPPAIQEIEIMKAHVPALKEQDARIMVQIAEEIRKGKANNDVHVICSTRDLISWAKLTQHVGIRRAAELAILNKAESKTDRTTVEDSFKMVFGKWENAKIPTLSEIEASVEEMKKDVKKAIAEKTEAQDLVIALEQELTQIRLHAQSLTNELNSLQALKQVLQNANAVNTSPAVWPGTGQPSKPPTFELRADEPTEEVF